MWSDRTCYSGDIMSGEKEKHIRKGSDPLIQTARGKLQTKRSKLNDQINRELLMRKGAENLFRATENKRLKELVSLELSFFNSNIQLLKEELLELNSSVEVYQHDSVAASIPMIPMGLKETKEVDFKIPIKDFILEHYSEDGESYDREIQELMDIRQAVRTPVRDETGVDLLFQYYNQLYFMEKRFFPPDRRIGIHFTWFDSLTGVPHTQRTVGYEKGSILFNIAALYTQIACKQDRTTIGCLEKATRYFERAAGAFRHLHNNFSHAPSMDMRPQTLSALVYLMLAQAQECTLEMRMLGGVPQGILSYLRVAQEAAMVSKNFMGIDVFESQGWVPLEVKQKNLICPKPPATLEQRKLQGKGHLREAILLHEEALRIHNLCKQLRKIDTFQGILRHAHDRTLAKFAELEEEDDFTELVDVPLILAQVEHQVAPIPPELPKHKVPDVFERLGPIKIFSAKTQWSAPRTVTLQRRPEGFGFSVRGDMPVIVADVESQSVAEEEGMKVGDFVVQVSGVDTKWAHHDDVVKLVRQAGNSLTVKLVTPMGQSFLDQRVSPPASIPSTPSTPTRMQSPNGSMVSSKSGKSGKRLSASWIFARKNSNKDNVLERTVPSNSEVMLR
ncbi:rhophilin-2-B-like [Liolophura sinensis]|uniref:rhophilin-2-B-like n=1 Tax=Liolophura sinensis TaxID=3198878 RepID=UPI003158B0F3